nr:hypothetical protein [Mycobacterium canetti]
MGISKYRNIDRRLGSIALSWRRCRGSRQATGARDGGAPAATPGCCTEPRGPAGTVGTVATPARLASTVGPAERAAPVVPLV